ncbi:beta-ketoacyl-ACP synthase III [Streptomyces sp. NPDC059096]|uniref:beta-ketoacyl-ACP synthase III n=1 Tax=unclassified Streptomyces TaxID=2593676 RepID=UPI00368C94E6
MKEDATRRPAPARTGAGRDGDRGGGARVPAPVICGIGHWLPPTVLANEALGRRVGASPEWLRSRTGVVRRHVAAPDTATSDMAVEAGRRAMRSAGTDRVDAVLVATVTPDRICPPTAPEVAARLGQPQIAAFDVGAACSGFLYGLAVAGGLIAARTARRVLVVGAETMTSLVDPRDPATSAIFADGAGAAVVRAGDPDEPGAVGPVVLGSDGSCADLIEVAAGGSRQPLSADGAGADDEDRYLSMSGPDVFRRAVARMAAVSRGAAEASGWDLADVDRVVAHQANAHILAAVGRKLGVPPGRMANNIGHVGNTSAASIPILLSQDSADGRLKPGDRVLATAFGAGLTWAATTFVWPELPGVPEPFPLS